MLPFYTYRQLSEMFHLKPQTIARALTALRREHPSLVAVSYRLEGGYRRQALLREDTVEFLVAKLLPLVPAALAVTVNPLRQGPPSKDLRRSPGQSNGGE